MSAVMPCRDAITYRLLGDSGNTPRPGAQALSAHAPSAAEQCSGSLSPGATPRFPSPEGARGRKESGGNAPPGRLWGESQPAPQALPFSPPFAGLIPPIEPGTGPSENARVAASEPASDPA